tara:strand:- start:11468 stop:11764 length:297 start_codon:yes stop_codon:yes gene_type:complete
MAKLNKITNITSIPKKNKLKNITFTSHQLTVIKEITDKLEKCKTYPFKDLIFSGAGLSDQTITINNELMNKLIPVIEQHYADSVQDIYSRLQELLDDN